LFTSPRARLEVVIPLASTVMATANISYQLPPLPDYTLKPLPPLIAGIPDIWVALALPVIAYWAVSLFFHLIDAYDLFPQYRLHTPAEVLKRNHVTRWDVFRDVVLQQIIQTIFGLAMSLLDEDATTGKDDFNVAWYAQKLRLAQRAIPIMLGTMGVNSTALASKVAVAQPLLAGALMGGRYGPAFATWELAAAKLIYWYGVPALQFLGGILIVDTWEYFLHRAMHMNKWLYGTLITPLCPVSKLGTNCSSHLPLPPPQAVCALCVRCPVQPPVRRLSSGYSWHWTCLSGHWYDGQAVHLVLYWIYHQDCG
jgi:hypothetical protein